MQTSRLNLPARKFFLKDIQNAQPVPNATVIPNLPVWTTVRNEKSVQFSIVWVQGYVKSIIKLEPDNDQFILHDGTADALICRRGSMPQGCCDITKDKYLMVVGELQQTGQEPVIKVMKIQDLSTNAIAEGMWKVEVMDLYRYT